MKQIDKLTKEQELKIKDYLQAGLKSGLNTEKKDKNAQIESVNFFYEQVLKINKPEKILFAAGPLEANKLLLQNKSTNSTNDFPIYYTQSDTHWTYFYKYFVDLFPERFNSDLLQVYFAKNWVNFIDNIYAVVLGDTTAIVIEHPISFSFDTTKEENNQPLHNLNGPALNFNDGYGLYFIDGLNVPEFIVTTPIEAVTKEMILGIENVDFRRCLIKRLGSQKTIEILGATTIDKQTLNLGGTYELLSVKLGELGLEESFPYLKMINPSTGEIHIEGVSANCKTVTEALAYRNGMTKFLAPEMIS